MPKKAILSAILLTLFLSHMTIGAQENEPEDNPFTPQIKMNQRSMGDQAFAISVGVLFPLDTYLLHDWPVAIGYNKGFTDSKLSVGGTGSLAYSFYLTSNLKLGLQLSGSFSQEINGNFAYTIPVLLKTTWEFHPWGRISIPVHLGIGMAMTSYKEIFEIDFMLRPGVGFYFDFNYEWSFGLDWTYWFIPQLGISPEYKESIANFMDLTLTAEYHF